MKNLLTHNVARSAHRRGWLDVSGGFRLLRDRGVPGRIKLLALFIGLLCTVLLELLEIPLETVVAVLLPFVGPAVDLAIDGAEFVLLPLLLAAAFMPHLQKRQAKSIRH